MNSPTNLPKQIPPLGKIFAVFFLTIIFTINHPVDIFAQSPSCTVSVSPSSVSPSSTQTFSYTIQNSSSETNLNWLQIVGSPSVDLSIISASHPNWSVSQSGNTITFSGNQLTPQESVTIYATIQSGGSESSGSWSIFASEDPGGSSTVVCSGDTTISIATPQPTPTLPPGVTPTPIIITDTVSAADNNTPVITLDQLPTNQFSQIPTFTGNAIDDSGITTVQYSLDNSNWISVPITTNTKVNFSFTPQTSATSFRLYLRAIDTSGNTGRLTGPEFSLDKSGPLIKPTSDLTKPFTTQPLITGTVTDPSGIRQVSFSYDGGLNWLPANLKPLKTGQQFSLELPVTVGGNYDLIIEAMDELGNISKTKKLVVQIDRIPPKTGSYYISSSGLELPRSSSGYLSTPNMGLSFFIAIAGGPKTTNLTITSTNNQDQKINIPLLQKSTGSLWTGTFSAPSATGIYKLIISAADQTGETVTEIGTLEIINYAKINTTEKFDIAILRRDQKTQKFDLFNASAYNHTNPLNVTDSGNFSLLLPAGTYYLNFGNHTHLPLVSKTFNLSQTAFVTGIYNLGSLSNPLNRLSHWLKPITISTTETLIDTQSKNLLPEFSLPNGSTPFTNKSLKNHTTLLGLIPTWHPQSATQLEILNSYPINSRQQIFAVSAQDSPLEIASFTRRLGLKINYLADPDGRLNSLLGIYTTPVFLLINNRGEIVKTHFGLINTHLLQQFFTGP